MKKKMLDQMINRLSMLRARLVSGNDKDDKNNEDTADDYQYYFPPCYPFCKNQMIDYCSIWCDATFII